MAVTTIKTTKGIVFIHAGWMAEGFENMEFGFDVSDPTYRPIFTRKQTLEQFAARGESVCLALLENKIITGFGVLVCPNENSRWAGTGGAITMELAAIEVARQLRNHGIARLLLSHLFSDPCLEEKIVFLSAYSWLWDLAYSGLNTASYREMLIRLYSDFGFVEYMTNEPNICLSPENIFMARIGENTSLQARENFKWMRFGITPQL